MGNLILIDDTSDHGGTMITSNGNFNNNGKLVCITGDLHSCPISGHGITSVIGSSGIGTNGQKVIKVGDKAGCGATLINSSSSVSTK